MLGTWQLLDFPVPLPPHPQSRPGSPRTREAGVGLNQGFPFSPQALCCLISQWATIGGPWVLPGIMVSRGWDYGKGRPARRLPVAMGMPGLREGPPCDY